MGLFDAPTGAAPGAGTNLTSGSPDYQNAIVQNTQRQLKPAYASALQQSNQDFSSRGLLDSGLGAQAQLGLQQGYLNNLGNTATNAATQGADLAEQNRQREEQRGWQVQDRDLNLQFLKDQANQQNENLGNQNWMNLIGQGAGALGTMGGMALAGPIGGVAGRAVGQGVGSLLTAGGNQSTARAGSSNPFGLSVNPTSYNSSNPNDPYGLASGL